MVPVERGGFGEGPWPPCSASLLLSIGQCRHLAVLFEIVWDSWHQGFMVFLTHPTFGKEDPNNGLMIFGLVFTLRRWPGLSALYRIINAIKENIYHRKLNDYRQITYLFEAQCSYKLSLAKLSFEPIRAGKFWKTKYVWNGILDRGGTLFKIYLTKT